MSDILGTLGSYVASKDSRLACAAAVILAELAPRDATVTRQLADALEHADAVRRPFIIEALGRIGTADAAAALAPLIKADGPASEQALRAIAHTASAALKPLLGLIGKIPPALLERVAECVARTGEAVAFSTLLNNLASADVDVCRAIRSGLRTAMTSFDAKYKEHLRKQLEKAFGDKKLIQHSPALIALMKIASDLGDAGFQQELVARIGADFPANVRRSALQSIGRLHLTGEQRGKLAQKILPLMLESDVGNLGEPALEAIRHAQLNSEHQATLRKLLNSTSSRIREFAMQSLASQGTARTLNELIACLDSPERSIREEALAALSRAPASAGPLCERLLKLEEADVSAETARALIPQAMHIPRKLLESLAAHYAALAAGTPGKPATLDMIQKSAEKRRAILNIFRAGNSPLLVDTVFERALQFRQNDEPGRACELLKNVSGLNGWTDEYRIEMALSGLCAGPKDLARAARINDANLRILEDVLSSARKTPADLARKVLKDGTLSRRVVYYLGFHFAERMQGERQFGKLVLENLSASRTEEGRQAREKLVIEGLVASPNAKAGILEERAKVMMTAADMAAEANAMPPVRAVKKTPPTPLKGSSKTQKPAVKKIEKRKSKTRVAR